MMTTKPLSERKTGIIIACKICGKADDILSIDRGIIHKECNRIATQRLMHKYPKLYETLQKLEEIGETILFKRYPFWKSGLWQ